MPLARKATAAFPSARVLLCVLVAVGGSAAASMQEVVDGLLVGYSPATNPTQAAAFAGVGPDECPAETPEVCSSEQICLNSKAAAPSYPAAGCCQIMCLAGELG